MNKSKRKLRQMQPAE